MSRGDASDVLRLTREAVKVAQGEGRATLLATLLLLRAKALDALGDHAASGRRLDGLSLARYGFGNAAESRLAEARPLSPWRLARMTPPREPPP